MSRILKYRTYLLVAFFMTFFPAQGQVRHAPSDAHIKPRVIVFGVNGAEWDILRPLLLRGEMPNLARVIDRGVSGKLRTVSAPNCPKVYSVFETSTPPEENGITGFIVHGTTANTSMLRTDPLWSLLTNSGVTVGMANVPATFPVKPVNGYMISGMLTRGKDCEDGLLCSPKLSEVQGGDAVYPRGLSMFFSPGERMPISAMNLRWLTDPHRLHRIRSSEEESSILTFSGIEFLLS